MIRKITLCALPLLTALGGARAADNKIAAIAVVAVVNGEKITGADLNVVLAQMGPTPVKRTEENVRIVHQQALSMLIDGVLTQQFLDRQVGAPKKADVDKKLDELKTGLKKSGHSLEEYLRETKQSEAHMRTSLAEVIQWAAFADKFITEEHLKHYYNEFRPFFDRVVVRASHVYLQAPPGADKEKTAATIKKLKDLRAQIVAGKTEFADAAKRHSLCPSGEHGGDIGTFPRKFVMDDEFARVAFSLKVGEVSDVVKTELGYHLIKVTERNPGTPSDFEKIKDDVREIYLDDYRMDLIEKLRKTAKIEVNLD